MPTFTTRVELHDADEREDYDRLHEEMEREGFTRTITASSGKEYQLPTAEYNLQAALTKEQVRDKAVKAARRTGKSSWILVTESAGRCWDGLPPV